LAARQPAHYANRPLAYRLSLVQGLFKLNGERVVYGQSIASQPPARTELIIYWICKPDRAEATLGCMEEVFRKIVKRHGVTPARWWFWWQTVRAVGAFVLEIIGKIPKSLLPTSN
jgi:hypothetical protein